MKFRDLLPEPIFTLLYVGGRDGRLCLAYGGTMTGVHDHEGNCHPGRVRVCDKKRGHFDSHTYEFQDVLEARHPSRITT